MKDTEVIDLNEEPIKEIENIEIEKKKVKKDNIFIKLKDKIKNLSKKQKIILGIVISLVVVLIVFLIIFFIKDEEEVVIKEPDPVVIEMDNYKYVDGVLYFYDSEEELLGTYTCENQSQEDCYLSKELTDDSLDKVLKVYEDYTLIDIYIPIYDNLVFVFDGTRNVLYDMSLEEIVGEYNSVSVGAEDIIILEDLEGKYALASLAEEFTLVTEFEYDYIGYISDNQNYVYSLSSDYGLLDSEGKIILDSISGEIVNYTENAIVTKTSFGYTLYSYDKSFSLEKYDMIKIYEDYIYAFLDGYIYVYDSNFNKINEVGIEYSSTEFIDYDIYSSSLIYISSEYSVDYSIVNDKTLTINGESYNIYESLLNGNYDYVNYINGILYFYEDSAKTSLIGTYECEVTNTVSADSTEFTSCFVSKEYSLAENNSSGYLPLINSKYVFIYDTQSLSLYDNIILYDLTEDKELANYSSADLLGFNASTDFTTASGTFTVVAKNTSSKLGVITLSSSAASLVIPFSYSDFDIYEDYYLLTDSNGYKFLYTTDGVNLNEGTQIKNDITGYYNGYLIVSSSSGEQIYSVDGEIISNVFKSVSLSNDYYLAIDNDSNIYIYSYTDMETNYFNESIPSGFVYGTISHVTTNYVYVCLYDEYDGLLASYDIIMVN